MVGLIAPMLSRVARRYESDPSSRTDLQQEMLIAVWLSLDIHEKSSSFQSYVQSVAQGVGERHVAMRRVSRRTERAGNDLESLPSSHDTEFLVLTHERVLKLLGLLGGLRPREREAVLLDLKEFDLHEMSHAMDISQARARDTLVRARRRLMLWMRRLEVPDPPSNFVMEDDCERDPRAVYHIERPREWSASGRT